MRKPRIFTWWSSAAEELERRRRREPARQVARPVEPRARLARRSGSATKRSAVSSGPAQVAARDADAADVELAGHADRHGLAGARRARRPACSRSAGRWGTLRRRRTAVIRWIAVNVDRRLGRAVEVDQTATSGSRCRGAARTSGTAERLAAARAPAGAAGARPPSSIQQHDADERGGQPERGHPVPSDRLDQSRAPRAASRAARITTTAAAVSERGPDLERRRRRRRAASRCEQHVAPAPKR